jgi:hypothetical protein
MNQEKPQSVTETKLCINTAQMRMFAMNYITHVIYGAHDDKSRRNGSQPSTMSR